MHVPEILSKIFECARQAVGTLIDDGRIFLFFQAREESVSTLLYRQESEVEELVRIQSRANESADDCTRSRKGSDSYSCFDRRTYEDKPWVRDTWRSCIADESDMLSFSER